MISDGLLVSGKRIRGQHPSQSNLGLGSPLSASGPFSCALARPLRSGSSISAAVSPLPSSSPEKRGEKKTFNSLPFHGLHQFSFGWWLMVVRLFFFLFKSVRSFDCVGQNIFFREIQHRNRFGRPFRNKTVRH